MDKSAENTFRIFEEMCKEERDKPRPKCMWLSRAARYYGMSRDKLTDRAQKAHAYIRLSARRILIDMDVMDEYFKEHEPLNEDEETDVDLRKEEDEA